MIIELLKPFSTGLTAFTATNLDDVLILLLFFSQVNSAFRRRHIIAGQYLGFAALVAISLPGCFGSLILPRPWIGMLGLVPIAIGISRLVFNESEEEETPETPTEVNRSWWSGLISSQSYSVAAVTFANGGDNIGIYVPLFASSSALSLTIILSVFFTLVGVWCYVADRLTQLPTIASSLTQYGNQLVPFVLIGLGILILIDSHTLENRGLAVLSLLIGGICTLHLFRSASRSPDSENGFPLPKAIVQEAKE